MATRDQSGNKFKNIKFILTYDIASVYLSLILKNLVHSSISCNLINYVEFNLMNNINITVRHSPNARKFVSDYETQQNNDTRKNDETWLITPPEAVCLRIALPLLHGTIINAAVCPAQAEGDAKFLAFGEHLRFARCRRKSRTARDESTRLTRIAECKKATLAKH